MKHVLRPLFDRVVIKELEPERFRRSGLLVPPGSNEPPPQHGIVLAVGQGQDWWEHVGVSMPVRPGDHVVFPASAGVWVEVEEERLLVCRAGQLLGVLEGLEGTDAGRRPGAAARAGGGGAGKSGAPRTRPARPPAQAPRARWARAHRPPAAARPARTGPG